MQDFVEKICLPGLWNKIYSGSHYFTPYYNKTKFIATFYDQSGQAPLSAKIYIDGVATNMIKELGNASNNTHNSIQLIKRFGYI